jgi:RNA polymerase sigma-70 factor (ECF subfamily)
MAAQLLGDRAANQAAVRADLLGQLQSALNGLHPLDRELLALRHFEELSNEAAATVLGLEPAVATVRYLQALKRLNEILRSIPGFFAAQRGQGRA